MVPLGLSRVTNIFIGKCLHEDNVGLAKKLSGLCMRTALGWLLLLIGLLWWMRDQVAGFYLADAASLSELKETWALLLFFIAFDSLQMVALGQIHGLDLKAQVQWANVCSHWMMGMPISYAFAFSFNLGLRGLWIGPCFAAFLITLLYALEVRRTDWQEVADQVRIREMLGSEIVARFANIKKANQEKKAEE